MSSRVFICSLLLLAVANSVRAQNRITIDMPDNGSTDLQSYLADLHVAVSSVQYTANMSARMLIELMDKLRRDEVRCQCANEGSPPRSANKSVGRSDYRRTSPVAAHKLHTRPLKWNDARKSCRLEGAELATVESIDKAQLLAKELNGVIRWNHEVNVTESAFMGVHSHFEANEWVNVRGDAVPVVAASNAQQRCAVLTVQSNLQAAECDRPRPYFCELRLTQSPS